MQRAVVLADAAEQRWFRYVSNIGSDMVQLWFSYGSAMVPTWFERRLHRLADAAEQQGQGGGAESGALQLQCIGIGLLDFHRPGKWRGGT